MQIREIMTPQVEVIPPNASVRDAAMKMKDVDVEAIPVCDGQKLTCLVTDRDITVRAIAEGRNPADMKVCEIMSGDIAYCFEEDDIEKAAEVMESKQIRRLPILNRDKKLAESFRSEIFLYARNSAASRKPLRPWKIYRNPANLSAKMPMIAEAQISLSAGFVLPPVMN